MNIRQETISISGFGGDYEDTCQRMLWRGVAYLAEMKPPQEMWKQARQSAHIVGVMTTEGDDLKALEAAIIRPGDDVSGVMHQAVMNHLAYIHQHSTAEWLTEGKQHRDAGTFIWVGELYPQREETR